MERSRDQFGTDSSYFIYPIAIDIPGLGASSGLGSTILNINETDLDFTGFLLRGDFDVTGGTFLNYHLIKNRLLFDFGVYNYEAAVVQFNRGIDSNKDDYIVPSANGDFAQTQLTWSFNERHAEAFIQYGRGMQQVTQVLDNKEQKFPVVDDSERDEQRTTLGFRFDNTSDRLHPTKGYRLEMALKIPRITDPLTSKFVVTDYNATMYIPFRKLDTLAFNFFRSDAHITDNADVSRSVLETQRGLNCAATDQACLDAQASLIDQQIARNAYGTATPLGGTQRLRSFANGRYYAGHSIFWGVEYRLELNDRVTPFDFYVAKGTKTGLQLAFFAEQGSVAERTGDLFDTLKTSYGIGFRAVLTGVVIRADYSNGTEGDEFLLFIDYPWSLLSIDS